jgi:hypothetical protein
MPPKNALLASPDRRYGAKKCWMLQDTLEACGTCTKPNGSAERVMREKLREGSEEEQGSSLGLAIGFGCGFEVVRPGQRWSSRQNPNRGGASGNTGVGIKLPRQDKFFVAKDLTLPLRCYLLGGSIVFVVKDCSTLRPDKDKVCIIPIRVLAYNSQMRKVHH